MRTKTSCCRWLKARAARRSPSVRSRGNFREPGAAQRGGTNRVPRNRKKKALDPPTFVPLKPFSNESVLDHRRKVLPFIARQSPTISRGSKRDDPPPCVSLPSHARSSASPFSNSSSFRYFDFYRRIFRQLSSRDAPLSVQTETRSRETIFPADKFLLEALKGRTKSRAADV